MGCSATLGSIPRQILCNVWMEVCLEWKSDCVSCIEKKEKVYYWKNNCVIRWMNGGLNQLDKKVSL